MSRLLPALLLLCLTACGYRGSLMMPPGPAPEPVFGTLKPATPPAADGSTDAHTRPQ